jgi:hypothetical protein
MGAAVNFGVGCRFSFISRHRRAELLLWFETPCAADHFGICGFESCCVQVLDDNVLFCVKPPVCVANVAELGAAKRDRARTASA